ncbi:MAG TPA: DNA repair protein RecN [Bacteroidales bacterium]|nr:DNA repair protein RecN [Bacteroidales bacterium]
MLVKLTIENYALIDELEIGLSGGFTVITGETGAGKSILLGALSLILGQRAETSVLLDPDRKCIVEGTFLIRGYEMEELFREAELDYDDTLILRREIAPNGKSRAFVNDTPVNLNLLKDLGDRLVNIHSQHTITTLNDSDFQLSVLDNYAGNLASAKEYRETYRRFLEQQQELAKLLEEDSRSKTDRDYYHFLLDELSASTLRDGEQEELEEQLQVLSHAEEIKTSLDRAMQELSEGDRNLLNGLNEVLAVISRLSAYQSSLKEISERLDSDLIDLKDIASVIGKLGENVRYDPEELDRITQRLDLIYRLEKKHRVASVRELLSVRTELEERVRNTGTLEDRINRLKADTAAARQRLESMAEKISAARKKITGEIGEKILESLARLAIPDAGFRVELTPTGQLTKDGTDKVRFLFSANKGIEPDEITRIASGGELSRLMLSIKSLISQKNLLPTIIFDEIDSGVSGEVAGKIGAILKDMGATMQVIAITHLPQIAGKGESHFRVYKESGNGTARSRIKKLNRNERLHEIAKMVSDEKVTQAAVKAARELLN